MSENIENVTVDNAIANILEQKIHRERRIKSRHRLYFDLIITFLVIYILFNVIIGIGVVQRDSMKPNFTRGSFTLFYRLDSNYKRNDIVVFKSTYNDELLIKRVVAVAGDEIDIDDKEGTLLVNGVPQDSELIIGKTYSRKGGVTFPLTVPKGCAFMMGDNREVSLDSRDFGTVDVSKIIGKVFFEIKKE